MGSFLPPKPPGTGLRWYVLSAALHMVFLGSLVWVSTHTRSSYASTHLVVLYRGPDDTRQFSMRVADPVGSGAVRASPDALGGIGRVSIAASGVGALGSPDARGPAVFPDSLRIGIPGASGMIPGAIVVGTRRRIGPAFGDGMLWEGPPVGPVAEEQEWGQQETTLALQVVEMLSDIIDDSLAARGGIPSWVTTIGGQQWGIDPQFIHLGPIKIPTVLAALLGFAQLPQMGNYELAQQQAWLADVRQQILNQALRMDQMDSFRRNVRALEARKRREREEERRRRGIIAGRDSIISRQVP